MGCDCTSRGLESAEGVETMIFIDTETDLIRPGVLAPSLVCVQICDEHTPGRVAVVGVDRVEALCRAVLEDNIGGRICGHNVAYDLLVIGRAFPNLMPAVFRALDEGRVSDTMIREKLIRIADGTLHTTRSFSLAAVAAVYGLQKKADDPWRLRYSELRGKNFDAWPLSARDYAVHDVEVTRDVYLAQGATLPDEARQVRAAFALHCVGASGIYTDQDAVDAFVGVILDEMVESEATLRVHGLLRADGTRDTKRAAARMLDLNPMADRTPAGGVRLDEEACLVSGDDVLIAYQKQGAKKTLVGRLEALRHPLINPSFDSLVASGRTSCRNESTVVHAYQVQNVRRDAGERECFVGAPGECIIACDYSVFELCCLAQVCLDLFGHSALADALNRGIDPHLLLAAKMLKIDYGQAVKNKKISTVKNARQVAKAANFGYPGGLGAKGFMKFAEGYGLALSEREAVYLRCNWFATWPEMSNYFDWVSTRDYVMLQRGGYSVDTTSITQLRSDRVRGGCSFTAACNTLFQGLAADAAKAACYAVVRACEDGRLDWWKVWNFIHDEILIRGPVDDCGRAARILEEIMVREASAWLPDVRVKAEATAMDRWSKSAERTLDAAGNVVPYIVGGAS